jgi:hypothetical protein
LFSEDYEFVEALGGHQEEVESQDCIVGGPWDYNFFNKFEETLDQYIKDLIKNHPTD